MKIKKINLFTFFLLLLSLCVVLLGAGCEKDDNLEGEWIQIDSLMPDTQISGQLSSIFTENNNCLLNFQEDTVCHVIFNQEELKEIDTCNIIPDIDFEKYTLVVGKVMVPGMVSSISKVLLVYNSAKDMYKIEVSIDECEECYTVIGYLYFWRVYSRIESGYDFKLLVIKT